MYDRLCDETGDKTIVVPHRTNLIATISIRDMLVKPAARPRKGMYGNIYQPKKDRELLASEMYEKPGRFEIDWPVLVDHFYFFNSDNKSGICTSHKLGDEDNLRKEVNDALVLSHWLKDDHLIGGGQQYKLWARFDGLVVCFWNFDYIINK